MEEVLKNDLAHQSSYDTLVFYVSDFKNLLLKLSKIFINHQK